VAQYCGCRAARAMMQAASKRRAGRFMSCTCQPRALLIPKQHRARSEQQTNTDFHGREVATSAYLRPLREEPASSCDKRGGRQTQNAVYFCYARPTLLCITAQNFMLAKLFSSG
jgi:hypothetical protein